MSIEEHIRVTGSDQAAADVKKVADATAQTGERADQTSAKAKGFATVLELLKGVMNSVAAAAGRMFLALLAWQTVTKFIRETIAALEKVLELQEKIAGQSVGLAGQSKLLAKQLGVSELEGMDILTQLRIAGGMNAATAQQFGIAADVAFGDRGGLRSNMETAKALAGFAGAKGFSAQEAASLMDFLKTAGALESPEAAKRATAQIAAAATASKAQSTGAFVGMLAKGGTGLLQAGVPLTEVLTVGGQARQVEVTEDLAAQSIKDLEMLATGAESGFTNEIHRVARAQGLDPKALTTAQRIALTRQILGGVSSQAEEDRVRKLMSAERGSRLLKAFRASNVAATANVAAAGQAATVGDFEAVVAQGREEMTFREAQNTAAIEFQEARAGMAEFTHREARRRARSQREIAVAQGLTKESGLRLLTPEAHEEVYVLDFLKRRAEQLRERGVDVSAIEEELGDVGTFNRRYGYRDENLREIAQAIDAAEGRGHVTVNNFTTNIGTNLNGPNPEARPTVIPDIGE